MQRTRRQSALLRREGLYSSLVTDWRRQHRQGALKVTEGRTSEGGRGIPSRSEVQKLRAENERVKLKLATGAHEIDDDIDGYGQVPIGTQIAYTRWNGSDGTAIFVIDAEGGAEAQLTYWELVASYADWSPDGQWIVFSTQPFLLNNNDGPISNLYRMRPDGSGVEPLTFYDAPNPRPNQPTVEM